MHLGALWLLAVRRHDVLLFNGKDQVYRSRLVVAH